MLEMDTDRLYSALGMQDFESFLRPTRQKNCVSLQSGDFTDDFSVNTKPFMDFLVAALCIRNPINATLVCFMNIPVALNDWST